MFQSSFHSENNILITKWYGKTSKENVLSFFEFLDKHDELPRHLLTLEVMENVSLDFEIGELADVASEMKRILGKYKTIRTALVSDQPLPVAYSMMYKSMTETFPHYKFEVFDVEYLAKNWLLD